MRARQLGVASLMLGLACGGAVPSGPPEIRYGLDACDRCRMVIDDPRYAAALRTRNGDIRRYDDIGELVAELEEAGDVAGEIWLHDHADETWIPAPAAVLVRTDLPSPMGSGLVAFRERAAAERLARNRGGEVLEWSTLRAIDFK